MRKGTKTTSFRIPEELKLQIEMQAFKENRSVNNFLQYIAKEYLENERHKKRVANKCYPYIYKNVIRNGCSKIGYCPVINHFAMFTFSALLRTVQFY